MEEYIKKYDSLKKHLVYDFRLSYGGICDCIKFFMFLLHFSINNDIKLHYRVNNLFIEKYLRLKYTNMYITGDEIASSRVLERANQIYDIQYDIFYIITPLILYDVCTYSDINSFQEIFTFTDAIYENSYKILPKFANEYISLHVRLGDHFLETDKSFVTTDGDKRPYSEEKIVQLIEEHQDQSILLFCDNHAYKMKLMEKYSNIYITNCEIGHTGLENTTDKQVLDTVTEFYILTNSQKIYATAPSGFSICASKFKNIPLISLYV